MASRLHATLLTLLLLGCPIQALLGWGCAAPRAARLPSPHRRNRLHPGRLLHRRHLTIEVDFAEGPFDLPKSAILARIATAASAVATYYGRFPARHRTHPRHSRPRSSRHPAGHHLGRHARLARLHAPPHRRAHHRSRACSRLDDHPRAHPHGLP